MYRWRLGHDTGPTDNANGSIGGSIMYSPFIRDRANLSLPHLPMMADTPITSVTFHASLRHPESTFNHLLPGRAATDGRTTRPAAAAALGRPLRPCRYRDGARTDGLQSCCCDTADNLLDGLCLSNYPPTHSKKLISLPPTPIFLPSSQGGSMTSRRAAAKLANRRMDYEAACCWEGVRRGPAATHCLDIGNDPRRVPDCLFSTGFKSIR